jgi:hypothetical protein
MNLDHCDSPFLKVKDRASCIIFYSAFGTIPHNLFFERNWIRANELTNNGHTGLHCLGASTGGGRMDHLRSDRVEDNGK